MGPSGDEIDYRKAGWMLDPFDDEGDDDGT